MKRPVISEEMLDKAVVDIRDVVNPMLDRTAALLKEELRRIITEFCEAQAAQSEIKNEQA